jgi:hypothetical protein
MWSLWGRFATILAGLVLVLLAWPGWLNVHWDNARFTRRVAWTVHTEESWRQAAEKLHLLHEQWRERGLPDGQTRGLNLAPASANYCAWFAPEEKAFFDDRFDLFPKQLTELAELRRGLAPFRTDPGARETAPLSWVKLFRKERQSINHVVLSGPERDETLLLTRPLWRGTRQWAWLYGDGRTEIFGWRGTTEARPDMPSARPQDGPSEASDPFQGQVLDLERLAFAPAVSGQGRPAGDPKTPRDRNLWNQWWYGPAPRPLAVDEALQYLDYFDEAAQWRGYFMVTNMMAAPLAAACPGVSGWAPVATLAAQQPPPFRGPAAAPLLAVRAARRGVLVSPHSAEAHLALASCLVQVAVDQDPYLLPTSGGGLVELRQVQIVTALQRGLLLKPEAVEPHRLLAGIYASTHLNNSPYFTHVDLAIDHWRLWLRNLRAAGPVAGVETFADFDKRLAAAEREVAAREKDADLEARANRYETESTKLLGLAQARRALDLGLAKEALKVLDDLPELGPDELSLKVGLLLSMGQVDVVRANKVPLESWNKILFEAALGDYASADQAISDHLQTREAGATRELLDIFFRGHMSSSIGPVLFDTLKEVAGSVPEWADMDVLRALLALEEGNAEKATQHLREARHLSQWASGDCQWGLAAFGAASSLQEAVLVGTRQHLSPSRNFSYPAQLLDDRYLSLLLAER